MILAAKKIKELLKTNNVFLSGGAGVGKSYTTKLIKDDYIKEGKIVVSLGTTAISAINIKGQTVHSFFAFGLCSNLEELGIFDKKQRKKLKKLDKKIKEIDLLIIDEISMLSSNLLEMIRLRLLEYKGKILFVGDFFQLPPVVKNENTKNIFIESHYAFSSPAWQSLNLKNVLLSIPKRTSDKKFYENLSKLRNTKLDDETAEYFSNFLLKDVSLDDLDDFSILCAINKKADYINERKLAMIEGEFIELVAKEDMKDLSYEQYQKWVNTLTVPKKLKIKIGAKIIFCTNKYEDGDTYYNGEQGVILDIFEKKGETVLEIQKTNSKIIHLKAFTFNLLDFTQEDDTVLASFTQFPIKPAYAITIHKSQGMSIEKLACDIDDIFEKGQLYVALSRATNPQNLILFYSKAYNFRKHFESVLKFDKLVVDFYKKNEFIILEENI